MNPLLTRQHTDRYIKLGVRLIALMLILRAAIHLFHDLRFALLWEFNPFGEIPDAWYLMTDQWHDTWGDDLIAVLLAIVIISMTSRIAAWCQSSPPEGVCPCCNYSLEDLESIRCPECGQSIETNRAQQ